MNSALDSALLMRLVPYDPAWPVMFEDEAARLREALGAQALRIDHVGSTAVPGMTAKPVIDIQISVPQVAPVAQFIPALEKLGYRFQDFGDFSLIYPFFHKPAQWPSTHHIHLCEAGGEQETRHLAFRNWLRRHPDVAAEYVRLKQALMELHQGGTLEAREKYSLGKGEFVEDILAQAKDEGVWP